MACIALADISKTLGDGTLNYRLIGGNMVNLHVHRWGLQDQFPRMTLDADVGMPKAAMRHLKLQETFAPLGYEKEKGDRITRPVPGYRERAAIDFLVSESTSRTRQNRAVGELIVSEAENLAAVFRHPGIEVELQMELLHSEQTLFASALRLPDEASAFVLKVGTFQKRYGGNGISYGSKQMMRASFLSGASRQFESTASPDSKPSV